MYHLILKESSKFKDYFLNSDDNPITHIPFFNKINIIVGANNSGKSRFMRNLMFVNDFLAVNPNLFNSYNEEVKSFNSQVNDRSHGQNYYLIPLSCNSTIKPTIIGNNDRLSNNRFGFEFGYQRAISNLGEFVNESKISKIYYIPTLRTAHSLYNEQDGKIKKIENDIYLQTIRRNYNLPANIHIFTGIDLYKDILNSRNSEKKIRRKFYEFEKFLSTCFFDNKEVDVVANFNKDDNRRGINESELILIHVEGESNTRKLYDLGDGIQAIIILMYKIFMAEPDSFIFIDEPELHLHPGMQRLFLEQISSNKDLISKNLTYIISTHSNHFLDLTIQKEQISIFSFIKRTKDGKEGQFEIRNVNKGDNQLLKHLGVNNSSVFMANCSIWVEGVSDRNYLKAFLTAYTKHLQSNNDKNFKSLKEDIDYAFFEYAGSNIEHYVFNDFKDNEAETIINEIKALALSNKIYLLADSDFADKRTAKGIRLKKLEESEKENFLPRVIWEVREIENLLTSAIWKKVIINFVNKDLLKNHLEEIKNRVALAFQEIEAKNYQTKYIGEYLNELRQKLGKIEDKYVLNKSIYEEKIDGSFGTFIPKRELSELVLQQDIEWEVFAENPLIVKLTEDIYKFITKDM